MFCYFVNLPLSEGWIVRYRLIKLAGNFGSPGKNIIPILQAKLVKGTRGEIKFLISLKVVYRLLDYQVTMVKNPPLT